MIVSVIIPAYQSWDLLEKCLKAISDQTYHEAFEVIVVNNDNDNNIPENLKKYKDVIFLQELKPGSYAARNTGILKASGEIIAFTDADCIPDKNWLKNGVQKLIDSKAGIVGGDVILFYANPKKPTSAEIYDSLTGFNQYGYIKQGNCVTANWFSYKEVLEEFGYFNPELKSSGDSYLSQKISKSYDVIFANDSIVFHPARYTTLNITNKYKRLIGGAFDRGYKNKRNGFANYVLNFIGRRIRFNINLLFKFKFIEFAHVSYIHFFLFYGLIKEYFHIMKTGTTKRL